MLDFLKVLLIITLVLINGFFVAAEFAIVKVRKTRVEALVLSGNIKAKYVLKVISNLNSYLSVCQLGITLASLGLGWIGEPTISELLNPLFVLLKIPKVFSDSIAIALAFILITGMHIVLGELAPKSIAILSTEKVAMFTAVPLILFDKIAYPVIWLFNHSANITLSILGIKQGNEHDDAHTDEEIKILAEESYKHGLIDKTELTFVDNIFDFSDTQVREIMIPRTDMVCLYENDTLDDMIKLSLDEQFTRYPVCREDKDDVIGFIHIKDLYRLKLENKSSDAKCIIRPISFIPETMYISVLLKIFQKNKEQMVIIVDEYGGTSGIVTLEDIVEEIVGDIHDEFDKEEDLIKQLDDNLYSVDGRTSIEELNELIDLNIHSDNFETIAGWFYSKIRNVPKINERVQYEGFEFIITELENLKILRIMIRKI